MKHDNKTIIKICKNKKYTSIRINKTLLEEFRHNRKSKKIGSCIYWDQWSLGSLKISPFSPKIFSYFSRFFFELFFWDYFVFENTNNDGQ